jgi:hypothetical protein
VSAVNAVSTINIGDDELLRMWVLMMLHVKDGISDISEVVNL